MICNQLVDGSMYPLEKLLQMLTILHRFLTQIRFVNLSGLEETKQKLLVFYNTPKTDRQIVGKL